MESSAAKNPQSVERRRLPRHQGRYDLDILVLSGERVGKEIMGKSIDISRGGLRAELNTSLPPGTGVELTVYVNDEPSVGWGEVVWQREVRGQTVHGLKLIWSRLDSSLEEKLSS